MSPAFNEPDTTTKEEKSETYGLGLAVGLSGRYLQDELAKSSKSGGWLEISGNHEINNWLQGNLTVGAVLSSGSAISLYDSSVGPSSYIYLTEASLTFKMIESFEVEAGVIGSNFMTMPSLLANDGFPGLVEKFIIGDKDGSNFTLKASQLLPSTKLETRVGGDTALPSLLLAGGEATLEAAEGVSFGVSANHFRFYNLPTTTAEGARLTGNSLSNGIGPGLYFDYLFEGYQAGFKFKIRPESSAVGFTWDGGYVRNIRAPEGLNEGYSSNLKAHIQVRSLKIEPSFGVFYNEKDTLPGLYTQGSIGQNNRRAYSAGLALATPGGTEFYTKIIQGDVIEDDPYLADRTIFTLGMEANYDIL